MSNPFVTPDEIKEVFHKLHLEDQYSFLEADLISLADAFIMAAMPAITRNEREMCVSVVRSLNATVADKLQEIRGHL